MCVGAPWRTGLDLNRSDFEPGDDDYALFNCIYLIDCLFC